MRNCCPACGSKAFVKNGVNRYGGQNHICRACAKQFLLDPKNNSVSENTKCLIDKLLLERLSLEGVCRVTGVSMSWLLEYLSEVYQAVPEDLGVSFPPDCDGVLVTRVEADELWRGT